MAESEEHSWEQRYHESLRAEEAALQLAAADRSDRPMTFLEFTEKARLVTFAVAVCGTLIGIVARTGGVTQVIGIIVVTLLVVGASGAAWVGHRREVLRRRLEFATRPPLPPVQT